MRRLHVSVLALLTALTVTIGAQPAAGGDGGAGANNVVLVSTDRDAPVKARARVRVAGAPADTVAHQNIALARSTDCTGCRTVAVAMQVVVVEGYPQEFRPVNAAVAANGGCTACDTYAFAYQYAIQPGVPVRLTSAAQQRLAQLRDRVDSVAGSGLGYDDMRVQLRALFSQVVQVVDEETRAVGVHGRGQASESADAA